jgi:hypothetical protein
MESHQRIFLLKDWEGAVRRLLEDRDDRGCLDTYATRMVEGGERFTAWLREGGGPHPGLREFLEERLSAFDLETGFEQLAYERGALAAAIEELR